jgi:pimeloyl-ACP methyl ester carboxylesterase
MTTQTPLLLLHGALGAAAQFDALVPLLAGRQDAGRFDFEGHGAAPLRARAFAIEHFAENVTEYLDAHGLGAVDLFGYSMGGYVALYLARTQPARVRRVATLGTKLAWTPEVAAREVALLDPAQISARVPRFAAALAARHRAAGWEQVCAHTAALLAQLGARPALGADDFAAIAQPVRLGVGDRDTTVTLDETAAAYHALPQGELAVWPNTPHPWEKVALERAAREIGEFFV